MRLTKDQNKTIDQYIIGCVDSNAYDVETTTDAEKLSFLYKTFRTEKNGELKRINPYTNSLNELSIFTDWLQGLPTIFTIEFENYKILRLAKTWGSLPEKPTEKQEDKILENYWGFMAYRTMKLIIKETK